MIRKLTFNVEPRVQKTEGGQAYLYVAVQPLADGERLLRDPDAFVFDTASLLAHRSTPSDIYLFTCSCGVPGCAGIHDPAVLTVQDSEVVWTFPEKWLRGHLSPALFPAGRPLAIRFALSQYVAALEALTRDLLALERTQDLPVVHEPGSPWEEDLCKPLEVRLRDDCERFLQWQEGEAWRRRVFGPLLNVEVRAEFRDDVVYATTVESLAHFMAERFVENDGNDCEDREYACVETQIGPLFRESPETILDAIQGYSWSEIEEIMWPQPTDSAGTSGVNAQTDLATLWADARLSLAEEVD